MKCLMLVMLLGCASTKTAHIEERSDSTSNAQAESKEHATFEQEPSVTNTRLTIDEPQAETPADVAPLTPLAEALRPELYASHPPMKPSPMPPNPQGAWWLRLPRSRPAKHTEIDQHQVTGAIKATDDKEVTAQAEKHDTEAGHADRAETKTPEMPKLPWSCIGAGGLALAAVIAAGIYFRKGIAGFALGILKRFLP